MTEKDRIYREGRDLIFSTAIIFWFLNLLSQLSLFSPRAPAMRAFFSECTKEYHRNFWNILNLNADQKSWSKVIQFGVIMSGTISPKYSQYRRDCCPETSSGQAPFFEGFAVTWWRDYNGKLVWEAASDSIHIRFTDGKRLVVQKWNFWVSFIILAVRRIKFNGIIFPAPRRCRSISF